MNGPSAQYITAIIIAVVSSGVWPIILPKIIEYKNRRKIEEAQRHEIDRDTWFRESQNAYKRVKRECSTCARKLDALNEKFFSLLDALDDMSSRSETGTVTVTEVRSVVRRARMGPSYSRAAREREADEDDEN